MTLLDRSPIVAIATAAGRGGIGVIRLSGKNLSDIVRQLCGRELLDRYATYCVFRDEDQQVLDQGIAIYFKSPHSYTGEDVLELQVHGGPVVLQLFLKHCLSIGRAMGLRLANPGEFTERAFLNDKIDLVQAEAVADLINASTEKAARAASASLCGVFSNLIEQFVEQLTHLRILVEATLDFPEEGTDFLAQANVFEKLLAIELSLQKILRQSQQGALLREGLQVVIAGEPNVGKSSLLNALAGKELAIVTPIAGTTRDRITEHIHIEGIPLHIIDTAGLRATDDVVEKIGIERSWEAIHNADVVLYLQEASQTEQKNAAQNIKLPHQVPVIKIINKIDRLGQVAKVFEEGTQITVYLSALTGEGIELLQQVLLKIAGWQLGQETLYLARERHLVALSQSLNHIAQAIMHAKEQASPELLAEELRLAQHVLSSIVGEYLADDLLGDIFSRFCIGK